MLEHGPKPLLVVPGTYWKSVAAWTATYAPGNRPMQALAELFGVEPQLFDWPGENSARARHAAARLLAAEITRIGSLHLVGFSHGGNIASEAAVLAGGAAVDLLVTIATPVTGRYRTGGARRHVHLYSAQDRMQALGGEGPLGLPAPARREFVDAVNMPVPGIASRGLTGSHGDILWSEETWRRLREAMNA